MLRVIDGKEKRVLHLTLTRHWFGEIASGRKCEEYRKGGSYWEPRFIGVEYVKQGDGMIREFYKEFDEVHFRNGYAKNAPWMRVEWKGCAWRRGQAPAEWNGYTGNGFVISLGAVLETRNWEAKK